MKYLAIITALFLVSCSTSKIQRNYEEGVYLKKGEIEKTKLQCTLVKVTKNMIGYKHLFVTNAGDTIYQTYELALKINRCYYIPKPKNQTP